MRTVKRRSAYVIFNGVRTDSIMASDQAIARQYINLVLKGTGLKPTQLARKAGIVPSTLNRFLNNPDWTHTLSLKTLRQIANASGFPVPRELLSTEEGNMRGLRIVPVRDLPVVGRVQAGAWSESYEWPHDERFNVTVPVDRRYEGMRTFCLEVMGSSMNRVYPEGAVVICVLLFDLEREPLVGERVVVLRKDRNGMVEATVKELAEDDKGRRWLWPRSYDPEWQQPIPFHNGKDDPTEEVSILAVVIGSYRPE